MKRLLILLLALTAYGGAQSVISGPYSFTATTTGVPSGIFPVKYKSLVDTLGMTVTTVGATTNWVVQLETSPTIAGTYTLCGTAVTLASPSTITTTCSPQGGTYVRVNVITAGNGYLTGSVFGINTRIATNLLYGGTINGNLQVQGTLITLGYLQVYNTLYAHSIVFPFAAAPSISGQMNYNTVAQNLQLYDGWLGVVPTVRWTELTDGTPLTNSTALTSVVPATGSFGTLTVPSGHIVAGTKFQWTGSGVYSTSNTAPSLTVDVLFQGTTASTPSPIATATVTNLANNAATEQWNLSVTLTCRSVTSNVCTGQISGTITFSTVASGSGGNRLAADLDNNGATVSFPVNQANTFDLQMQWGAVSLSNIITMKTGTLTQL